MEHRRRSQHGRKSWKNISGFEQGIGMMMDRRTFVASAASLLVTKARAQSFPSKGLQLIVPFAPGGAADIIGRVVSERLATVYGQAVIVENRAGAGSNTGLAAVAKSEPSGHVFGLASIALAVNPSLYQSMPFDPMKDLAPLTLALATPNIVIVPTNSAIRTIGDLVTAAKAKPGGLSYASAGSGSSLHLAAELFCQQAGVTMTHVPYRGSSPALQDLVGGRIDVMFDNASTAMPQVAGRTARAIAVTTAKRIAAAPDVPTVAEQGLGGYELSNWWAFVAPAGTPSAITSKLSADIRAVLQQEGARQNFNSISGEVIASTPDALAAHLAAEVARWKVIIAKAGIAPI
jgi:tripartite-type tricarboxylate transporter receptor subunit TctC